LEEQIASKFKASPKGSDGNLLLEQSTLLAVRKSGIVGIPSGQTSIPAGTYKDGVLRPPGFMQYAATRTADQPRKDFIIGERVYLANIETNIKGDKIRFVVFDCDICNGATELSIYRAAVEFEFAKGFLKTAGFAEVESAIDQVFAVDNKGHALREAAAGVYSSNQDPSDELRLNADGSFRLRQGGGTYAGTFFNAGTRLTLSVSGVRSLNNATINGDTIADPGGQIWTRGVALQPIPPPLPPANEPSATPPTISLGLSIDQVVAILGQPLAVADLGSRKIYSYKILKVTFVDGRVADIQ
jgi:hypothetical protein